MRKDIFSESKKLSSIVNLIRDTLLKHDFYEFFPPSLIKYSDNLRKGAKFSDGKSFYLLKPDITSCLIEMDKVKEKQKIYYICEILDENLNSTWQLGYEILDGSKLESEEEVIKIAITILTNMGIENFFVDVSSVKTWKDLLDRIPRYKQTVIRAIEMRNFDLIEGLELDLEIRNEISKLFNFRGKHSEFENLNTLVSNIDDERIYIDLGTMKYMDYYEDIVFEIYMPGNGRLLANGGQYTVNDRYSCGLAFNLDVLKEVNGI